MDVNRANLDAMFAAYSTAFQAGVDEGLSRAQAIEFMYSMFPSATASNFYGWLDKVPGFRPWVGDRVYNNVMSRKFEVLNKDFESSVSLSVNDIEDNVYGTYTPVMRMAGASWLETKRSEVLAWLTSKATSSTEPAFTGKALIADDHAYGAYTIDNKTTDALSATAFEDAIIAASTWQYSNGELIRPRWTHLAVGPKLRQTGFNIVKNTKVAGSIEGAAIDNPNFGAVELVVFEELAGTYDDYWFLLGCGGPIKPFAVQIRKEPTPLMDTDPATLLRTGKVDVLAHGRMAAAPTFPHLVYGGIL